MSSKTSTDKPDLVDGRSCDVEEFEATREPSAEVESGDVTANWRQEPGKTSEELSTNKPYALASRDALSTEEPDGLKSREALSTEEANGLESKDALSTKEPDCSVNKEALSTHKSDALASREALSINVSIGLATRETSPTQECDGLAKSTDYSGNSNFTDVWNKSSNKVEQEAELIDAIGEKNESDAETDLVEDEDKDAIEASAGPRNDRRCSDRNEDFDLCNFDFEQLTKPQEELNSNQKDYKRLCVWFRLIPNALIGNLRYMIGNLRYMIGNLR